MTMVVIEYYEKIISDLHEQINSHATGDTMVVNLFDENIRIDKGVVNYVRTLKYYPDSKMDFPFRLLDGRPGGISTSPLGVVSKDTGIPEFIGFYERDGGAFATGSYDKALDHYISSVEKNHICYLLTPKMRNFDLSKTSRLEYVLDAVRPNPCVMLIAGTHHDSKTGLREVYARFYNERKVIVAGDTRRLGNGMSTHLYHLDIEGNSLRNKRFLLGR